LYSANQDRAKAKSALSAASPAHWQNYLSRATVVVPSRLWLPASPVSVLFHIDTKSRN